MRCALCVVLCLGDEELTPALAAHIEALWNDPGIQATYLQRHKYQLTDSTKYFLDQVKAIAAESYLPSDQDVLRSRVRTTGIVSNEFIIDGNKFQMYDVGGQRNERKKWIHCFEGVTAVLFVAAISEYDQNLYEDETMNRVTEALILFDEICNSRWFKKTSLILFLNKCDIFAEKIQKVPLTVCFPEYSGPQTYEDCAKYMQSKFEQRNKASSGAPAGGAGDAKKIYTHMYVHHTPSLHQPCMPPCLHASMHQRPACYHQPTQPTNHFLPCGADADADRSALLCCCVGVQYVCDGSQ